ncbi:flippase [Lelliottia wanjuensis]|uniref:flippase n=1 Tax=Lelliottia wanjuensis TaxID=3050585 RepID=UPI00255149FF|nr:flippase [Lelliottia sp. V104_15]MDK9606487.1 flippase [Lelliottia sp. V104_15]
MVIKNVLWQMSEKIIRLSVTVIVGALMARYLGPEGFGKYNYITAILAIMLVVTSLGFNRILVRESANCTSEIEHKEVVSTSLFLRLASSIFSIIVISLFLLYFGNDNNLFYLISLVSVVFVSFDVIDYHLQGQSIFKVATSCRVVGFIIASLLRVWFVYSEANLIYFYSTVLIEYLISGLLIFIVSQKKYKNITNISFRYFSYSKAKSLLKESWPEIIAGFGAIIFMKMDQIMLQKLQGDASVGIYSAATRISEAWYFIPAAIVAAVFPLFMKKYNEDKKEVMKQISCVMSLLVWMSIFAAIFVNIVGDYVIHLIYGVRYLESSIVLKLHIWAGIFLCMGITSGSWLVAEKKLRLNLYRNLSGLALNFVLNILLIPIYGTVGAAIATIFGLAMAFFIFDLFHKDLRAMFWIKLSAFSPLLFIRSIKYILKLK